MANKKIVIIAIIIVAIASVGAYLFASEVFNEKIPDFTLDGEEINVTDVKTIEKSNKKQILSLQGVNFTIPKGLNGNLSYQAGFPRVELFNGNDISDSQKYIQIYSLGKGTAKDKAQEQVDQTKGSSIGRTFILSTQGNATVVYINEGSDIISKNCFIQVGEDVFNIIYYGVELSDFFKT